MRKHIYNTDRVTDINELKVTEVADIIGVSPTYIYRLIRNNRLPTTPENPIYISKNNILEYFQKLLPPTITVGWAN